MQAGARRKHEHGSEFILRCWRTLHPTVDCRLQHHIPCKLWLGERNRTLLRGLYLHPTAPQLTIPTTSVQFLLIAGYSCQFLLIRRGGGYPCTLQPTIW